MRALELHSSPAAIALAFGLQHPPDIQARYNIAPTQPVPGVRLNRGGERELAKLRRGPRAVLVEGPRNRKRD